jgi:hypothetical protein
MPIIYPDLRLDYKAATHPAGLLGTMQTATDTYKGIDREKPGDWSQTDLQTECSRPDWVTEEGYDPAQGRGEKTSEPVLEIAL